MFWRSVPPDDDKADKANQSSIPNVGQALGSLSHRDRLQALIYAFSKAREAGDKGDGDFDTEAAIAALKSGTVRLSGSPTQIAAQLLLIHGAAGLVERALSYSVADGAAHPPLETPKEAEKSRPQPIKSDLKPRAC